MTETKRVVQVTCQLEGKEELEDFLLSKRRRREVQVEVRFGSNRRTSSPFWDGGYLFEDIVKLVQGGFFDWFARRLHVNPFKKKFF